MLTCIKLHFITSYYIALHCIPMQADSRKLHHFVDLGKIDSALGCIALQCKKTQGRFTLPHITVHHSTLRCKWFQENLKSRYITFQYITFQFKSDEKSFFFTLHYIMSHYFAMQAGPPQHDITLRYKWTHFVYLTLHYKWTHDIYIALYYVTLHCKANEDPGKLHVVLHYITLHYVTLRQKRNQESFCNELHYTMQAVPEQLDDALHYKESEFIKHYKTLHYFTKPA